MIWFYKFWKFIFIIRKCNQCDRITFHGFTENTFRKIEPNDISFYYCYPCRNGGIIFNDN